jgi:hypothetical protein
MCIKNVVLCTAIILGTASTAVAAGPNGSTDELRKCIANLQASGRHFAADPDMTGLTEYDVMVGRCQRQLFRMYGR